MGLTHERAVNLYAKEYLTRFHGTFLKGKLLDRFSPLYAKLWEAGVLLKWERCDILHFLLDGVAARLLRRARQEHSLIIGEAVTCHPALFYSVLLEEYELLGIRETFRWPLLWTRQLREVADCDVLLAPSRFVGESFAAAGYDRSKITTIPYGVDLDRFMPPEQSRAKEGSRFKVICVGAVAVHKGQIYLLEAWRKLKRPNAELVLVGRMSNEMAPILRRYQGLFRHVPFVPNNQLWKHYSSSSVFVLASLQDGFAVVICEAMACGLPVITTVNTGSADVVSNGRDGFVVPIRSPEAIAERLELLYRDEELRQEMSRSALAKARSELSWQKYADRLCDLYRTLVNRRAGEEHSR
jgi:glycosyltransferase involved in cell wall biosynthesis